MTFLLRFNKVLEGQVKYIETNAKNLRNFNCALVSQFIAKAITSKQFSNKTLIFVPISNKITETPTANKDIVHNILETSHIQVIDENNETSTREIGEKTPKNSTTQKSGKADAEDKEKICETVASAQSTPIFLYPRLSQLSQSTIA